MDLFFKLFVWICFAGLVAYTVFYGRNEEKMDKKVFLVRKIWYLLYVLGALIYWTSEPTSIFTDWSNYLIVVAIFVCVDAFIFLNLYLKKAGNYELDRLTQTVSDNGLFIEENLTMAKNMLDFLNNEGIIGYYDTKEDYLLGLREVLNNYASKEDMTVEILPFTTDSDKQQILNLYPNKGSIRSKLDRGETIYIEKYALQLINFFEDEDYILKIKGERDITEMDCTLLGILIIMYELVRPQEDNVNEEGESL